jgi:hypothetical protein
VVKIYFSKPVVNFGMTWEADAAVQNREAVDSLLLGLKRALRGKVIQMIGQPHLNNHCEYYCLRDLE